MDRVHLYDLPPKIAPATRNVKLPRDGFQPKVKNGSMNFGLIRSGGASPSWYSPKAERYTVAFADLALTEEIMKAAPAQTNLVELTWLGELFSCRHSIAVKRDDGRWFLPLRCESGSAIVAWPLEESSLHAKDASRLICFHLAECRYPMFLVVSSLSEWTAVEFKAHSPAWQSLNIQAETGPALPGALALIASGNPSPLLEVAARAGFWALGKTWLETLGDYIGNPVGSGSTPFEVLQSMVAASLPGISDEELLLCLERRLVKMQHIVERSDAGLAEAPDISDFLEKQDVQRAKDEAATLRDTTMDLKEFRDAYREQAAKVRPIRMGVAAARVAAACGRRFPKNMPVGTIPHSDAKLLAPVGPYVWRNNTSGAWCGRYPPYPELSRAWMKHTERGALLAVLRRLWLWHLTRLGLSKESCPIADLFVGDEAGDS